jgi:hypothetical protein
MPILFIAQSDKTDKIFLLIPTKAKNRIDSSHLLLDPFGFSNFGPFCIIFRSFAITLACFGCYINSYY